MLSFHQSANDAPTPPPRGSREIRIGLNAGADFTTADVIQAGAQAAIAVSAKIKGYIFGGVTYQIDPNLKTPPVEVTHGGGVHKGCSEAAPKLLECLRLRAAM